MGLGEVIVLDPFAEGASNRPLQLSGDEANGVSLLSHDYPTPDQDATYVSGPDVEGDRRVSTRKRNRRIPVKLRIAEPQVPAATNLVTNPSFEVDAGDWSDSDGHFLPTLGITDYDTVPTAGGRFSDTSLFVSSAALGGAGNEGVFTSLGVLTAGVTYCVAVDLGVAAGSNPVRVAVGRTTAPYTEYVIVAAASAPDHTTFSALITPAATAAYVLYTKAAASAPTTSYEIDRAMVIEAPAVTGYFDGDSPGCSWTGIPHASTSVRPAAGGDRLQAIITDVTAKVEKLDREGGTYRRTLPNTSDQLTFDVESAKVVSIDHGKRFGNRIATEIELDFEARPLARQPEVLLSVQSEAVLPVLSWVEDQIPGDVHALGRLVITEAQGQARSLVLVGMESLEYSADATAAPWLQAEAGTAGVASAAAVAGASGSGNNTMTCTALTTVMQELFSLDATRVGAYRVWARLWLPTGNAGTVSVALRWTSEDGSVVNDAVSIDPALEAHWLLVDVGHVASRPNSRGQAQLTLAPLASSTTNGDDISVDGLLVLPVGEFGGELVNTPTPAGTALPADLSCEIADDGVLVEQSAGVWRSPGAVGAVYEGDYLQIPPTLFEGRSVRLVVKACRGTAGDGGGVHGDDGIDDISAHLAVTPRWLVVPGPS